jgi:hypothetical protein
VKSVDFLGNIYCRVTYDNEIGLRYQNYQLELKYSTENTIFVPRLGRSSGDFLKLLALDSPTLRKAHAESSASN